MTYEIVPKSSKKFCCIHCDYNTSRESQYARHLLTTKHLKTTIDNKVQLNSSPKKYICTKCDKLHNDRAGLWRHKKKCFTLKEEPNVLSTDNNLIIEFLKQNQEFQKQFLELVKDKSIANTTNNTNSNNSNSFNLNFFLNETCKGALNISEFIETIKVQLKDLERVGKLGYVEGITDIIIRGLKELDVAKRPIHCSDIKRETLYVKNDNIWENDKDKEKMKHTIQHVAGKNFKQIHEWIKENPDSKDSETKKHDEYMRIINKSTGGMTEEEDNNNYNKIIKKVASEVIINKEN